MQHFKNAYGRKQDDAVGNVREGLLDDNGEGGRKMDTRRIVGRRRRTIHPPGARSAFNFKNFPGIVPTLRERVLMQACRALFADLCTFRSICISFTRKAKFGANSQFLQIFALLHLWTRMDILKCAYGLCGLNK